MESTEQTSIDYLKPAFAWVDALDVKHPAMRDFHVLKSLSSALRSSHAKPRPTAVDDLAKVKQKLRDVVRYSLADISKRAGTNSELQDDQLSLVSDDRNLLRLVLEAADAIPGSMEPLKLPKGGVLENLSISLARSDTSLAWALRKFLLKNNPSMYDNAAIVDQLAETSGVEVKVAVDDFLGLFMGIRGPKDQADLVSSCLSRCRSALSAGSLLAVQHVLEHISGKPPHDYLATAKWLTFLSQHCTGQRQQKRGHSTLHRSSRMLHYCFRKPHHWTTSSSWLRS